MRWIFSLLLLANAVYFVWQNPLASVNKVTEVVPEGARELRLVSEIDATLLLPRGNRDGSMVDERSLGGSQVIEGLTEDNSLDGPSLGVGSLENSSLKNSSPNSGALEDLSDKASLREISAVDESSTLLTMLLDEPPVTERPGTNQSVTEQPVTEQSVTEQPVTERPVTEWPGTDQSATEQSVTDRSVTDQPVTDQPVTEQSITEQPVIDQPVTDQSATEPPVTEQSVTDQPATDQPATDQPVTEQPATDQPVAEQWCQVVRGLREEAESQQLLGILLQAGFSAEVKTTEIETVLAFELIMDRPVAAVDNAALLDAFVRLDMRPQELQLNGIAVYVLGRFSTRNEVDEKLSLLKGKLVPRIYQVVSKDSYFEVWVESDDEAETPNKINLLASDFSNEIKIEKKSCKGVASTEGRD